ncbi:MAG TPA: DoxX family protein [Candidatus Nanoarchaeia archaeon]|nr:DoxX family protein [Candidatus Nanoarchaeia archaeon]
MDDTKRLAVATLALRISLGLIFLVSAIGKIFLGMFPPIDKILPFIPLNISAYLLGLVEFIVALMLLSGFYTRIAAAIAGVLLIVFLISGLALGIFMSAGLLKDIGLLGAAVALWLIGSPRWGLDAVFVRRAQGKTNG